MCWQGGEEEGGNTAAIYILRNDILIFWCLQQMHNLCVWLSTKLLAAGTSSSVDNNNKISHMHISLWPDHIHAQCPPTSNLFIFPLQASAASALALRAIMRPFFSGNFSHTLESWPPKPFHNWQVCHQCCFSLKSLPSFSQSWSFIAYEQFTQYEMVSILYLLF